MEDSKRLCTCMLDTALAKLPPGGEQLLGVIDLQGLSLANIDLEFVAFMVEAFFVYYPRRCVVVCAGKRSRVVCRRWSCRHTASPLAASCDTPPPSCSLCTHRFAQVLLVDAPWFFKGPWEAIKPLLRKYAGLVRFVSRAELADEYFTPDALPPQFGA
jgi:hypothetical protein